MVGTDCTGRVYGTEGGVGRGERAVRGTVGVETAYVSL